ncbi:MULTISPECIES: hypothetical protein [unclassified Campylobacter]|uniref:hypothetical protein n=1 Tax=unclassified Campylobacter TaxID=2593542 RepID=UPI0014755148|nr:MULTISPECIES: hypothetical protein [unclassified Campylobacter]
MDSRGVKLVLDKEKILREGVYDWDEIQEAIEEKAEEFNFRTFDNIIYRLIDSPRALADMALFVYHFLFNFKAVTDNVKEFIWLTSVDKDFDLTLLLMKQGKIPKTEKYYEYENRIKKEIEFDKFVENNYTARRGVKLILDEKKIEQEGIYDLEGIYKEIDQKAIELNFKPFDGETYWLKDSPRALADMALFVYHFLFNLKAVTDNVKEFVWLTSEDGDFDLTLLLMKHGKMPKTEKYYEYIRK